MEFGLFLFFLFFFFFYLFFGFIVIIGFGIFSATGSSLFIFLQKIFSSDHNIFWSPVTSVFVFFIWFWWWRRWFKFFLLLFTWRVGIFVLKEFFHLLIELRHNFVSQLLFHCIECFCGIFIKFLLSWWNVSSYIIINFFQCFQE